MVSLMMFIFIHISCSYINRKNRCEWRLGLSMGISAWFCLSISISVFLLPSPLLSLSPPLPHSRGTSEGHRNSCLTFSTQMDRGWEERRGWKDMRGEEDKEKWRSGEDRLEIEHTYGFKETSEIRSTLDATHMLLKIKKM